MNPPTENLTKKPLTLQEMTEAAHKRVQIAAAELENGFEFLKNYPRSVTFFGSARMQDSHPYYEKARRIAHKIVEELHYSIITGGGPGIMQAANRGAYEAGGNSIGITISLPSEQVANEYLTDQMDFHYFFTRKVCLSFSAEAYLFFPGGFGTLDEFLEILTLVQTRKIPKAPIILVGEEYWNGLYEFFKDKLQESMFVDKEDTNLFHITDDESKILEIVRNAPVRIGVEYNHKETQSNKIGISARPLSELSNKHCVPCEGGTLPLSRDQSETLLKKVSDWVLKEDKEISKTYEFESFATAMKFIGDIGILSESEGHHPNIKLHDYKKVDIEISTHAINGLSENDFILASKIDDLFRSKQY